MRTIDASKVTTARAVAHPAFTGGRQLWCAVACGLVVVGAGASHARSIEFDAPAAAGVGAELSNPPVRAFVPDTAASVPRSTQKALQPAPTRADVVSIYFNDYLPGNNMPALNWTGNLAACNPGSVSLAAQQAMIDRVNVYRRLARLQPVQLFDASGTQDERVAAAALLMAANQTLSHNPPSSWTCYNAPFAGSTVGALGSAGAGASNIGIAWGLNYASNTVVDDYMDDDGVPSAGHRLGLLDPRQTRMATGVIPDSGNGVSTNALMWIDFATRTGTTATPDGVAWPPKGFIPYQLLPTVSTMWSFSYPGANFSNATVSMTSGGAAYAPTSYTERGTGCSGCVPEDAIVWTPPSDTNGINGVSYSSPGAVDKVYNVTISGVTGSGVPSSFSYQVTVIDPAISPTVTISGTIANGGTPVPGVTFCAQPATGVNCSASNASGAYSCTVPAGWSGRLHSPMVGNHFIPAQSFSNVTTAVSRNVAASSGVPVCNLDVDNNGLFEPATDGVAILRRAAGFAQASFAGLSGACAANTTAAAIYGATNTSFVNGGYNVTGGGATLALVDAATIVRAMRGATGSAVAAGLGLGNESGATNTSWTSIQSWLNTNCRASF